MKIAIKWPHRSDVHQSQPTQHSQPSTILRHSATTHDLRSQTTNGQHYFYRNRDLFCSSWEQTKANSVFEMPGRVVCRAYELLLNVLLFFQHSVFLIRKLLEFIFYILYSSPCYQCPWGIWNQGILPNWLRHCQSPRIFVWRRLLVAHNIIRESQRFGFLRGNAATYLRWNGIFYSSFFAYENAAVKE